MDARTKKKLIIAAIVAVVIIGVIFYLHFVPVWTSVVNVVVAVVDIVVGWIAHVLYNKYIKE